MDLIKLKPTVFLERKQFSIFKKVIYLNHLFINFTKSSHSVVFHSCGAYWTFRGKCTSQLKPQVIGIKELPGSEFWVVIKMVAFLKLEF